MKLLNLSYMFCGCTCITNIEQLKYLDVKYVKDMSFMLSGCSGILDINPLKNWDASNCTNFACMFFVPHYMILIL